MNGYDFDGTIYKGDSFIHFYVYCLLRFPYILLLLPVQLLFVVFTCFSRKYVKQAFAIYLIFIPNVQKRVVSFWEIEKKNIKPIFLQQLQPNDIIISASPVFLLQPICEALGIKRLIATNMHAKTGRIYGKNCYGEEKLVQFQQECKGKILEAFYSDSYSDMPMKHVAKKWYYVQGNCIKEVKGETYERTKK